MATTVKQCPLCGSRLSQTKFREVQATLRDEWQKKATELADAELDITGRPGDPEKQYIPPDGIPKRRR